MIYTPSPCFLGGKILPTEKKKRDDNKERENPMI
jgi:hypothetical protein